MNLDPTLLHQPFDGLASGNSSNSTFSGMPPSFQQPAIHPPSPAASDFSNHDSHRGSLNFRSRHTSPHIYHPYAPPRLERRNSVASRDSRYSHDSPRSTSLGFDEEGKEKGRCPHPDCGRLFKDLKAHMLTHQSERPEKCPIVTCVYHTKGFARKYDRCRHTLTHYKGTMVCDFCPGGGSAAEKSFNRADVFKRHLTTVHGVEQSPPNSRKKSPTASSTKKGSGQSQDTAGKCSTCSSIFSNAQDFYDHLDDCVLKSLEQEEPSEMINEQRLAEVANDKAMLETLDRHMLPSSTEIDNKDAANAAEEDYDEEEEDDDENGERADDADALWHGPSTFGSRSGKGAIKSNRKDLS